jgi:hypothetical protein
MPVVAKGKAFVFATNLTEVAKFLGVQPPRHTLLPPSKLLEKWIKILSVGQCCVRQLSTPVIRENATTARDKPVRIVAYHIFRNAQSFLECALDGARDIKALNRQRPPDDAFNTGEQIASYGAEVISGLKRQWQTLPKDLFEQRVEMETFGTISFHHLLERCICHSAQHTRQIIDVLERKGIKPSVTLTDDELEGLPLPRQLWS